MLSPLADLLDASALSLPSFAVGAVPVDGVLLTEVVLSVFAVLSGLTPVLPASPLGVVDLDWASTPAAPDPERPLGPCDCAMETSANGIKHAAKAMRFFIAFS